jgi:hypothetical protein
MRCGRLIGRARSGAARARARPRRAAHGRSCEVARERDPPVLATRWSGCGAPSVRCRRRISTSFAAVRRSSSGDVHSRWRTRLAIASHHVSYFDASSGVAFSWADTAGVSVRGRLRAAAPTPPAGHRSSSCGRRVWPPNRAQVTATTVSHAIFGPVMTVSPAPWRALLENLATVSALVRASLGGTGSETDRQAVFRRSAASSGFERQKSRGASGDVRTKPANGAV